MIYIDIENPTVALTAWASQPSLKEQREAMTVLCCCVFVTVAMFAVSRGLPPLTHSLTDSLTDSLTQLHYRPEA